MKKGRKITGFLSGVASTVMLAVTAFANPPDDAGAIIGNAGRNTSVENIGNTAKGIASSVYTAVFSGGVIIAVIALIVGFVRLGINRNSQKRDSAKDSIIWVCAALVVIGGCVALVSAGLQIGSNMRTE